MGRKIFNFNLILGIFFAFSGYYVILLLVANYLSNDLSRMFTIPLRILIILSFFALYRKSHFKTNIPISKIFYVFSAIYILRILIEKMKYSQLYMTHEFFLLYFLGFVLIPFYLLSNTKFQSENYQKIFYSILFGSFLLSVLTYFFYGDLIGSVSRISQEIGKDENYISPLALSYCSVLGISTGFFYLIANKVRKKIFILISSVIVVCLIPFFLGSSRGSVFALVVPFILYILFSNGFKRKIKFIFIGVLFISLLVYSTSFFGTGVFDRITGISNAIDSGGSSAIRLLIWEEGFNQFLQNPIMGNSLQSEFVKHHPHNILIETLITTGIVGFIPFILFLFFIFKRVIRIIRDSPQHFWIASPFLIGFMQNMFSGAIWGMSWVAVGAALIIGFDFTLDRNEQK